MAEEKTFSVGVQTSSPKRISVTSNVSENPITASADTGLYYSQLAKNWAIGEGLIQNEDYSSKTWAGESKSSADLSKMYSEAASLDLNNLENRIIEYDEQLNTTIAEGLDNINTSVTNGVETIETLQANSIAEITTNKESALSDITTASNLGLNNITTAETNALTNIATDLNNATSEINTNRANTLAQISTLANTSISDINATGIDTKVSKSGDTMTGVLNFKNGSSDKIRMTQGDYSTIAHQNGESFYLLLTDKGNPNGTFNSLRPLRIDLATGGLYTENPVTTDNTNRVATTSFCDGNWVGAGLQLMSSANTASNTLNQTFSLADYLPNDGKPYQIFITAAGTSSGFGSYNLSGGYNTFEFFRALKTDFATSVIMVVSSAHNITIKAGALTSGTNKFSLYIGAYRRVR